MVASEDAVKKPLKGFCHRHPASVRVQSREKKKQTGHGQGWRTGEWKVMWVMREGELRGGKPVNWNRLGVEGRRGGGKVQDTRTCTKV